MRGNELAKRVLYPSENVRACPRPVFWLPLLQCVAEPPASAGNHANESRRLASHFLANLHRHTQNQHLIDRVM